MRQKDRIKWLRNELERVAGGDFHTWTSEAMPPHLEEQFLKDVLALETAPKTTSFQQLTDAGVALPPPDTVSEQEMSATLWAVIHGLAEQNVFLKWTNHLTDRQLYEVLWKEVLPEEIPMLPKSSRGAWHIDLPGGDAAGQIYLKYYAGEKERTWWYEDFPECHIPAHEDPPYDRDRHLPTPCDEDDLTQH